MPTITTRALRGSTIVAIAAVGVLGLAGCSGGSDADEQPTTSTTEESPEASSEPTTSETPEAEGAYPVCDAEQLATLTSSTAGSDVVAAAATADFQPAVILGDLPVTCVAALDQAGISSSFAVLPGGAATITTIAQQATAAGGSVTEAGGAMTGTVEGLTVAGVPFTTFTQETAGFDDVSDLVVVAATSLGS
ncbi:hypothetical protein [Agrococcus sp. SGAir0287]|uniref:hypothetical protein n=1 Tax=Agrococcus sp. SGAir0287 TaxID=2070347 RepID=UPI0010CD083E|nr:hypothetical protein [Agrococcus sp. SGAir0287]QCR20090.1 hypothetical protein C1N71_12105 [Agrococcus sp. SGAir0287]